MAKKLNARQKLRKDKSPKIVTLERAYGGITEGGRMYVATPLIVDAYIRTIARGDNRTIEQLREALAQQNECDGTCPMSTSIFNRMSAEAALEDIDEGADLSSVTPFWRVLTSNDKITKRLDIDPTWVDERRAAEQ